MSLLRKIGIGVAAVAVVGAAVVPSVYFHRQARAEADRAAQMSARMDAAFAGRRFDGLQWDSLTVDQAYAVAHGKLRTYGHWQQSIDDVAAAGKKDREELQRQVDVLRQVVQLDPSQPGHAERRAALLRQIDPEANRWHVPRETEAEKAAREADRWPDWDEQPPTTGVVGADGRPIPPAVKRTR